MQLRDCQEIAPVLAIDPTNGKPCLFRRYAPCEVREAAPGSKPIHYAASQQDLAETIRLMCEANRTGPPEAVRDFIVWELERHSLLPKRPDSQPVMDGQLCGAPKQ